MYWEKKLIFLDDAHDDDDDDEPTIEQCKKFISKACPKAEKGKTLTVSI